MADLGKHAFFTNFGVNSTPTSRTGFPTTLYYIPVNDDFGNQIAGSDELVDVPTQHKLRGLKYQVPGKKNSETTQLATRIWPDHAKLLLECAHVTNATSIIPNYHGGNLYWVDSVASGSGQGVMLSGILFKTTAFTIDRDSSDPIGFTFDAFVNQDAQITGLTAVPDPEAGSPPTDMPSSQPYLPVNTFIDVEFGTGASGSTFTAWTGNDSSIKSLSYSFDNALEVSGHNPNSTSALNRTWTRASLGAPTLSLDFVYYFNNTVIENYGRPDYTQKARCRIMFKRTSPGFSATSTDVETAGSSKVFTVTPDSGFTMADIAVDDCVMIEDTDNGRQDVCKVTSVALTDGTITVETLNAAMDGSGATALIITSGAAMLKVGSINVRRPTKGADGNFAVLNMSTTATLLSGETDIVTVVAQNDDGT